MSSDRQLVLERDRIAEVDGRVDLRHSFALGDPVHQCLCSARISVRIDAKRTESLAVRNDARVVLRFVAALFKILSYSLRILLEHLSDRRHIPRIVDACYSDHADHECRQLVKNLFAYFIKHIISSCSVFNPSRILYNLGPD